MQDLRLKTIQVVPMFQDHQEALGNDLCGMVQCGICTDIAFIFTMVPEGNPPYDKAQSLCDRYRGIRASLGAVRANVGILAQATIGHGYTPDTPADFQKITAHDGREFYMMCPMGGPFQEYLRKAFTAIAKTGPDFIMVDDDFRLLHGRGGCFCPLHIAEINRRTGRGETRESLSLLLARPGAASSEEAIVFDSLQQDSMVQAAGVIRQAVDAVDPEIPISFCTCVGDVRHADAVASALAAKGQQRVVRINNGRYLEPGQRNFAARMVHTAFQRAALAPETLVLAEPDTCPHNRYSMGAQALHGHYAGSILEGCGGAKHWLTRTRFFEPGSGIAYRNILVKHRGFYEELYRQVRTMTAEGIASVALPQTPYFNGIPARHDGVSSVATWGGDLLGRMGIPANFVKNPAGPVMMKGGEVEPFADEELARFLKQGMILDGKAAWALCKRGFERELGVRAEPWPGARVSQEHWLAENLMLPAGTVYYRLAPADANVNVAANLMRLPWSESGEPQALGPAVACFENHLGGRIVIFAGTPEVYNGFAAFSFLNETRKRQLISLMEYVNRGPLSFYYPGDAELYLKTGKTADGAFLVSVFNLGLDPLEALPLRTAFRIKSAELLAPDGCWRQAQFTQAKESIEILAPLLPMNPAAFRFRVS